MLKKFLKKSIYLAAVVYLLAFTISCEKDFVDIGSNVITNTKFDTNSEEIEVILENSPLERLQSDNITRQLGQYLLGVYNRPDYEKLEASIITQVGVLTGLKVVDDTYGADTTVITKIDTAFIKLPYQVSLNSDEDSYKLDSVFGDPSQAISLNVYRSNTYINTFNPLDPSKRNSYFSDATFEKIGDALNDPINYQFAPSDNDTLIVVKRRLFDDSIAASDTITITPSTNSTIPYPFARIPLNETKIKELFLDKFESGEFASQSAFNDYLRGIIIEPSGNEGALVSFSLNSTNAALIPSIEIYYTNTVLVSGTIVTDTLYKKHSFPLSGFRVNTFKMDNKNYPINNEVKIQGTAGSEGKIQILNSTKISELRSKNWLINDATLTLYINQSVDTTNVPERLYLYKNYNTGTSEINSHVKDAYSEGGFGGIGGALARDTNGKKERYVFNITDYISDIVSGEISTSPDLKVKAFNTSDIFANDTTFTNLSWSPKAVTLFNQDNNTKKPVLKISYSEKK